MFGSLLWKECKMWLKSIIFYAYIILLFLFYVSQMGEGTDFVKPEKNQADYGMTYSEDESVIMNETLKDLIEEYTRGYFETYPIGFYKKVILSEQEKSIISDCISELTGKARKEWEKEYDTYIEGYSGYMDEQGQFVEEEKVPWSLAVSEQLTYKEFKEIMKKVSDTIGAGSEYSENRLKSHGIVPKTYEQAMAEYEEVLEKDKVTGAYARLFSDYIGIVLGILPAFFVVTRGIKDRKNQVSGVIYSKKVSSGTIVLSRYLAMIIMMVLPVLAVSCLPMTQSLYIANNVGVVPDYLAYVKYVIGWLLPTILFVAALAFVITELTESMLGILVNGIVWFCAMFLGLSNSRLINAGWNLIPRFNGLGEYKLFQEMLPQLVYNRCFYTILSFCIIVLCVVIYDKKRKGGYQIHGKVFKNSHSKCEA
ncbi:MAG: ABC transporter permease [Lachnospiraceae bacterium]|nr:ABC transporter permease [Lachnospiraceae bacterium]